MIGMLPGFGCHRRSPHSAHEPRRGLSHYLEHREEVRLLIQSREGACLIFAPFHLLPVSQQHTGTAIGSVAVCATPSPAATPLSPSTVTASPSPSPFTPAVPESARNPTPVSPPTCRPSSRPSTPPSLESASSPKPSSRSASCNYPISTARECEHIDGTNRTTPHLATDLRRAVTGTNHPPLPGSTTNAQNSPLPVRASFGMGTGTGRPSKRPVTTGFP